MLKFSLLLVAVVLQNVSAIEEIIITQRGGMAQLCESACQRDNEEPMLTHCKRGCTFFDLAQHTQGLSYNKTMASAECAESCHEAYDNVDFVESCVSGCNQSVIEMDRLEQLANHLVEETEKQVNFFNSILQMMSSAIWQQPSSDNDGSLEYDDDLHSNMGLMFDDLSKINRLEAKNTDSDVELISLMGDDISSITGEGSTMCETRKWLHTLSFILIMMGSILLVGLTIFYMVAIIKLKKNRNVSPPAEVESVSKPPSYDTLVRNGHIVFTESDLAPVHHLPCDKMETKSLIA